jgi:hypothetical protein
MFFLHDYCIGNVEVDPEKHDLTVTGTLTDIVDDGRVVYLAAAPPDYHFNYSGSGFPFMSAKQAFTNTPNKGELKLEANQFVLKLLHPNGYYDESHESIIPPTVYLNYKTGGQEKTIPIQVADNVPYRHLNYPLQRDSTLFYDGTSVLPVRTQEGILRDAGFPSRNSEPVNFWGLKPRC